MAGRSSWRRWRLRRSGAGGGFGGGVSSFMNELAKDAKDIPRLCPFSRGGSTWQSCGAQATFGAIALVPKDHPAQPGVLDDEVTPGFAGGGEAAPAVVQAFRYREENIGIAGGVISSGQEEAGPVNRLLGRKNKGTR